MNVKTMTYKELEATKKAIEIEIEKRRKDGIVGWYCPECHRIGNTTEAVSNHLITKHGYNKDMAIISPVILYT